MKNATFEACKIFIEHGANLNWTNKNGDTLVHVAAIRNQTGFLDYLVRDKKVDINTPRKRDNWTPLHCAALWNHIEICKYLIDHGADTRAKSKCGKTPAQVASDQDLIDYIGNASATRRNRRGVEDHFAVLLQNPPYHKYKPQRIAKPVNSRTSFGNYPPFGLHDFLVPFHLLIQYFVRDVVDSSRTRQQTFSPIEAILQNRIDPIAEKAIDYLPHFTDP